MKLFNAVRAIGMVGLLWLGFNCVQGQEGHPMSGTWVGEWTVDNSSKRVVVVLDWLGTELTATINPGPNAIAAKVATANPQDWSLHMEAAGKDSTGKSAAWVVDGKIDDLGTYNRSIAGTWKVNATEGTFSITRQ